MDHARSRQGLIFGIGAYGLWGLIPLYFKQVGNVAPVEVLAHRIVWSCLLMVVLVSLLSRWKEVRAALRDRGTMARLGASTTLIALNWLTYINAVNSGQVLQSSLGYFITPLMNVLLGVLFLQERLRGYQLLAISLALAGVAIILAGGSFPWIALTLSTSFALYGLLRKTVAVDGLLGLTIETLLLLPLAGGYLVSLEASGEYGMTAMDETTVALLLLSGVITTVPLLMFAAAARRLTLATLGILQYIAPSVQFLLAVLAFGEPFSRTTMASFVCIWTAVAIYSCDSILFYRRQQVELLKPLGATEA